jgi:hypothetical protein
MFQTNNVGKIKTHIFMLNNITKNRDVYEIVYQKYSIARKATEDNKMRRMCLACWIAVATDTLSEYVTFIAFPLQQWLGESASISRYMYNVYLVTLLFIRNTIHII